MLLQLDFFNNLLNNVKENNVVQNFIKELSDHLENKSKPLSSQINSLKQEDCLYQVVEMGTDGAYLQNVKNNKIFYETDIPKEILVKIGNDSVLRNQNGEYVIEEELTQKFFDSLVGIKEYKEIQNNFTRKTKILEIDSNTKFKIEIKNKDYSVLSYGNDENNLIKVPNELIPFWANIGENLCYTNGKFNREL